MVPDPNCDPRLAIFFLAPGDGAGAFGERRQKLLSVKTVVPT
jgi:hypothetical protein